MIPLLAATSAIGTIGNLGSEAMDLWKRLTESKAAGKANAPSGTGSTADGFAAMLSEKMGRHAASSTDGTPPGAGHDGPARTHHPAAQRLDRLA